VAINPRTNAIYVANYADGTVTVFDAETGRSVATIPVGVHPQAVAVDAHCFDTGKSLLVANMNSLNGGSGAD
ncbi:MAG: hypothetical protein ABSF34_19060, partial [Verrucomicrobiota bacterium]